MPSGGGFAGGGGGGGGFGGGGGYSGGRSSSEKSSPCITCLSLVLTAIIIIVIVVPIVVTKRRNSSPDIATNFYSPGDSRLISFKSFFCDGVNVNVNSVTTGASVFVVDTLPPLNERNNFTVTDTRTLASSEFHFWQYYLYPNSNISISVCSDSQKLDLYIVKGNSNANQWARSPGQQHAELSEDVTTICPHQENTIFGVREEDEYYVILYNSMSKSPVGYTVALSFERFEYNVDNISSFCSAPSGGQCTVDIPYGTGSQQALVVTTIPNRVDWTENVDIKTTCNRRDWAYALVILLPLLVVITVVVVIVIGLIWFCCY